MNVIKSSFLFALIATLLKATSEKKRFETRLRSCTGIEAPLRGTL